MFLFHGRRLTVDSIGGYGVLSLWETAGLFLMGALPTWPHGRNLGYFLSGGLGLLVLIPDRNCSHGRV
jgi:hypothetical protein